MKKSPNITFVGAGNMGGALIKGMISSRAAKPSQITAIDVNEARLEELSSSLGINTHTDPSRAAEGADLLVLAVKPQIIDEVMRTIGHVGKMAVLSVAAGITIESIRQVLGLGAHVIRCMPNTPALVGAGMSAVCAGPDVTDDELKTALKILRSVGRAVVIKDEKLMDAVTAVSGSGPAYAFMIIEAMADGGVLMGLDRATALELAAQTLYGAARLVLETGKHPGELKDMVTSPAGTTVHAVEALEEAGLRGALMSAVRAAATRSKELGED